MKLRVTVLIAALFSATAAAAHHGWVAYDDAESQVVGTVVSAALGAPHGELKVRAANGVWNVQLAPPAAIQRSGLTIESIPVGTTVTARGHKRVDGTLEIKTERLIVGERTFDLYPARP